MKYTDEKDLEDIRRAMEMLFAEFRTSLPKICRQMDLNYNNEYQHLYRYKIDHSRIQKMIDYLTPQRKLQRQNNRLVITRNF